jgi:PAS domain S-box-containing protein
MDDPLSGAGRPGARIGAPAMRDTHPGASPDAPRAEPGFGLEWFGRRSALVILLCLLVVGSTAVGGIVVRGLRQGYAEVDRTQQVMTALSRLGGGVSALGQERRRYMLTGRRHFLEACRAARAALPQQIAAVRRLTPDLPEQQRRLDLIAQQLGEDAAAVAAASATQGSGGPAEQLQNLADAEQMQAALRETLDAMMQEERDLQATHIRALEGRADEVFMLSGLRTVIGATCLCVLYYLARRDRAARHAVAAERAAALAEATRALRQEADERRQAEMALRGRDMMFRGLSDAMPQIVFVAYADGNGEFINRRWHDYTDAPSSFARVEGWAGLVHPTDLPHLRQHWQSALHSTAPFMAEFRLRSRSGEYRWFLGRAVPVAEAGVDAPVHWVGTLTDIDDIRQADAALRESEDRFRRIFEGSPFGMTLSDGASGRLLQVNPAFCRMLGYRAQELIGRSSGELAHPEDKPEDRSFPMLGAVGPGWVTRDKRLLTRQGGAVYARLRVAMFQPLDGDGAQLLTVAEDITRQQAAEEALRQAQRMDAVGQLSGGLAHDFNNLLGIIIGNIECLLDTLGDDPERAELAREVLESALSGAELTRRLLAFGRRQALSPQRIDLNAQVTRQVTLLSRTLAPGIQVETALAQDLWPTRADPSQLGDALLNLAINARDAMPASGVLTIGTHNDRIQPEDVAHGGEISPGDYVVLAVTDTGSGMTPEVRARAIEPFFTTKGPGEGSGLGLSMIYGFVRQSGGHLLITSEPGTGTRVCICLPRFIGADPAAEAEAAPAGLPTGNERILVVDDNPEMRLVAERHLRALGYEVLTAPHGPAALALLQAGTPVDLLFTDVAMPEGMNGMQLAEAALRLRPGLKVLFTTGYAGLNGGAEMPDWQDRLIRKPYRRRDLAETVRAALLARADDA